VDVVLVLDTSNSMDGIAPEGTEPKIVILKDAADLFIQAWTATAPLAEDRIGVVFFNSGVSIGSDLAPLLQSNAQAVIAAIVEGEGLTAMGMGLQTAIEMLTDPNDTESNDRKYILLFTNGMQNVNPKVVITGTGDLGIEGVALSSHDIPMHTIGTGVSGSQWQTLLSDIATETVGLHSYTSAPGHELEQNFLTDLVNMLSGNTLEFVDYRHGTFSDGEPAKTEAFTLNKSVKTASFLLSWRNVRETDALSFKLIKDGSIEIPVSGANVPETKGKFYTLVTLQFPLRTAEGSMVYPRGTWDMVIEEGLGSGSVPYRVGLIVDEVQVKYRFGIPKKKFGVGDKILVTAEIKENDSPVKNLKKVQAIVTAPQLGLGTFLSKNAVNIDRKLDIDKDVIPTPVAKKEYLLFQDPKMRKQFGKVSSTLDLYDNGRKEHGDKEPGDGIYSNLYKNTNVPGDYHIKFIVDGETPVNGTFIRTQSMNTTVRIKKIDASKTRVIFRKDGGNRIAVVTPIDSKDNYMGPGYGHLIKIEAKGAELVGALKDNLAGSYEQALKPLKGEKGTIFINILGTTIEKQIVTTNWLLWIVLLVIVVSILFFFFRLAFKKKP
jgi:hypothetical protein